VVQTRYRIGIGDVTGTEARPGTLR
jgi:hypothetical protein